MNRFINILPIFLLLLAFSCNNSRNLGRYNIEGSVSDTTMNGLIVDITIPLVDKIQDSTIIKDGKFSMKGTLPSPAVYQIRIRNKTIAFAATEDNEKVKIHFDKTGHQITSGEYSIALSDFSRRLNEMTRRFMVLSRNLGNEELVDDEHNNFKRDMIKLLNESIEENRDNVLGMYSVWQLATNLNVESSRQLDSLVALVPMANECVTIAAMRKRIERLEATQVGEKFADFDFETISGQTTKLSDYIGNGNYVLAYIWTSWLSTCWEEFPYIKENHDKFRDKGLVVIGVNVFDKRDDFEYVVSMEDIEWEMGYVNDGKSITSLYGINNIPTIFVIDPNGVIVGRGMRADQTGELLEKLL